MPGRSRLVLTDSDKRQLEFLRRATKSAVLWSRITAILMWASGHPARFISHVLAVSRKTLTNWRQRWTRGGFFRLEDAPRSGRPPRVTSVYIREMVRAVRRDPRALGFAFTRWTAPRLGEYLNRKTGIRVSPKWMAELLAEHGFVWRRTKRTLRNLQDPAVRKRAEKRLKRLKKGL
jgi:transposase